MDKTIRLVEELSMNAHPTLNEMYYDGWVLRFAQGYTDRANSVWVLRDSDISCVDKIRFCEEQYTKHGLDTTFKISPLNLELDMELDTRGYKVVSPTDIMVRDLAVLPENSLHVTIAEGIPGEWQENFFKIAGKTPKQIATARQMYSKMLPQAFCAGINVAGKDVACGMCVIDRGYVGIYDIHVTDDERRKGYGYELCLALLTVAAKNGAKNAYLQVVSDNEKAHKLYEKLGYEYVYSYQYRKKSILSQTTE